MLQKGVYLNNFCHRDIKILYKNEEVINKLKCVEIESHKYLT